MGRASRLQQGGAMPCPAHCLAERRLLPAATAAAHCAPMDVCAVAKAGKFLFLFKRCGHVALINPQGDLIVNPSERGLLPAVGCFCVCCVAMQRAGISDHSRQQGCSACIACKPPDSPGPAPDTVLCPLPGLPLRSPQAS